MPEIINSYKVNKTLYSDNGVVSIISKEMIATPKTISDIKEIKKYSFSNKHFKEYKYFYPIIKIPLLTSRECCYGKCLFCTNKGRTHHKCRILNAYDVVDCIQSGENIIYEFIDDNIHAKYLKIISEEIIKKRLKVKWISNSRFYKAYLDLNFCQKLSRSGCKKLFLGLESYNQETLDRMHKGIEVEDVLPILRNFRKAGIKTHISILFGFPGETKEQAQNTQKFIVDNIDILDLVEINKFVDHRNIASSYVKEYDVDSIVKETREFVSQNNKNPNYYNVYKTII